MFGGKMKKNKHNRGTIRHFYGSIGNKVIKPIAHVSGERIVTDQEKSVLVTNAVRRAVIEYGEVLRKLADE